ncbi:hypothetical protein JCM19992_20010 [Thermostilla marina]
MTDALLLADWLGSLRTLYAMLPVWIKPLWIVVVYLAVGIPVVVLGTRLLRRLFPRVGAIVHTTAREATSQPIYGVLVAIGVIALLLFPFIPYNTLGEDIKMLKIEGLTLIKLLAVVLSVWTASLSVAEEIEGRTALTLLSKPVARWQFVVGKFLGVMVPVALLFVVLGALFLTTVSYKVKYESRELARPDPSVAECQAEMVGVLPGLALSFMEACVLGSIAVAVSMRLPLVPNLMICSLLYILGHLLPTVVDATAGRLEFVSFAATLLSVIVPMLENFSIETAIGTGKAVSSAYLSMCGVLTLLYVGIAFVLALLLFEERDLA